MNCVEPKPTDLLIIQHHPAEGPGRILDWAKHERLSHHLIDLEDVLPESCDEYQALVLLGGPLSVNDHHPRLEAEQALLRQFMAAAKPILGVCLGAQLLAASLGSEIRKLLQAELGWCHVFFGSETLLVPQWHEDEIVANEKLHVLAHSGLCHTQMFIAENQVLGLQFHPEWNDESIAELQQHFTNCPVSINPDPATQARLKVWLFDCLDQWWRGKLRIPVVTK